MGRFHRLAIQIVMNGGKEMGLVNMGHRRTLVCHAEGPLMHHYNLNVLL